MPGLTLEGLAALSSDEVYTTGLFEGNSFVTLWGVSDPAHPDYLDEGMIDGPEAGMVLDRGQLLISGMTLVKMDPGNLNRQTRISVLPFGPTLAIGSSLAYAYDGARFSVFTLDPLHYLGTGVVPAPSAPGGIAEVAGLVYATDAQGIHIFQSPCSVSTGVEAGGIEPGVSGLATALPDPFRERTDLRFSLARPSAVGLSSSIRQSDPTLLGARPGAAPPPDLGRPRRAQGRRLPWVYFVRLGVDGARSPAGSCGTQAFTSSTGAAVPRAQGSGKQDGSDRCPPLSRRGGRARRPSADLGRLHGR
jgi:hypothetical protein